LRVLRSKVKVTRDRRRPKGLAAVSHSTPLVLLTNPNNIFTTNSVKTNDKVFPLMPQKSQVIKDIKFCLLLMNVIKASREM